MSSFRKTKAGRILVVSERPVLREALKQAIEEWGWTTVITAPDEHTAARLVAELAPTTIVIDRPDIGVEGLGYLFQYQEQVVKVIVIGWSDDKIAVYSRQAVQTATWQNLIEVMSGNCGD